MRSARWSGASPARRPRRTGPRTVFPKIAARFYAAGPEAIIHLLRGNIERWQSQRLLRPGDAETMATQFIGILLGNFSTRSLLGLAVTPTPRQLNEWVSCGVRLFLEGMIVK